MKLACSLFALIAATTLSQAAITITVQPDGAGTRFSVSQEADNPSIFLNAVTTGVMSNITLSSSAFTQNLAVVGFVESFAQPLGTLTEIGGAGSSDIVAFSFVLDSSAGLWIPGLELADPINMPPGDSYRFDLTEGETSTLSISFEHFVPGTYVESNPAFGTITTIVVPETGCSVLFLASMVLVIGRRSRL